MSTETIVVVGGDSGRQKIVTELGSCELYPKYLNNPNYPDSLGMFQTKAMHYITGKSSGSMLSKEHQRFTLFNVIFVIFSFLFHLKLGTIVGLK